MIHIFVSLLSNLFGTSGGQTVFVDALRPILEWIVSGVQIVTIFVLLYGFIYGIVLFVQMHVGYGLGDIHTAVDLSVIRVKVGSYILLALEFLIVADIILTVGDPSIAHLIQLGAIVLIRIAISYFLQQEMNELQADGVHH